MAKQVILTGLRANGELHLGSYLGSIMPMVRLQNTLTDQQQLNMFVADLHSFTTPIAHTELYGNILQNVRMYLAAGIQPDHPNTILYRQSFVPQHTELAWILECFTYMGEASRMTEFKDKSKRLGDKTVTAGLFNYPMLMAADIFLYGAEYVPLGDDQKQHIELIRTIGERFNNKFGDVFTVPARWDEQLKFAKSDTSVRIYSLTQPENKMSKSIEDPKGTIGLLDSPKEAYKKIMSATTDSLECIHYDIHTQIGISNLLQIAALLDNQPLSAVISAWDGKTKYGELKTYVAQLVESFLTDFQNRFNNISEDDVQNVLLQGEQKARLIATETLLRAQRAVGLRAT